MADDFPLLDLAPHVERARRISQAFADATAREYEAEPISEHEFLYGESPHPKTVAHTAAVVERVQALTPPSLVRMDRAEALVAQVVIWRRLELGGQGPGDQQWDAALAYIRDLADKYTETTT